MEDPLDIEKTAAGHRFPNRGFGDSEDAGSKCALEGRWIEEIEKKNHRGLGCRISVSGLRSTNLVYSQLWVVPPDPPGEIVCSVVLSTTAWYH